jgi:hypothetical protein
MSDLLELLSRLSELNRRPVHYEKHARKHQTR